MVFWWIYNIIKKNVFSSRLYANEIIGGFVFFIEHFLHKSYGCHGNNSIVAITISNVIFRFRFFNVIMEII